MAWLYIIPASYQAQKMEFWYLLNKGEKLAYQYNRELIPFFDVSYK